MRALTLAFVAAAAAAFWFGIRVVPTAIRPFETSNILELLATLAIIALFVERTIEVTIGAWRGKTAEKLFSTAENARLALISAPSNLAYRETVTITDAALRNHRADTRKAALRAAVVLGLLVAAAGVRTLEVLLVLPATPRAAGLFRLLDLLMTGAAIGGGSEPIHKMMSAVTTYLDAVGNQFKARAAEAGRSMQAPIAAVPPVTPGPPVV
jgi:hypothetical protein